MRADLMAKLRAKEARRAKRVAELRRLAIIEEKRQ